MTISSHNGLTMDRLTVCTVALIAAVYAEQTVIIQPQIVPLKIIERNQVSISCKVEDVRNSSALKFKWSIGERIIRRRSKLLLTASYIETGRAAVAVNVQYPPDEFSQRRHGVFRGEDAGICQGLSGNPTPRIRSWKRVGVTSKWMSSDCRIRQVNKSHSGDYLVVMENTMFDNIRNETRNGTGVLLVHLVVLYGAQVMCPSNYTAIENTTVVLECQVDASPPADITWSRAGSPEALPQTDSSLRIPHVQLSDGGKYTCTASNTISDYTGRIYKKEDSCTILVIVRANHSDEALPETTSIFALHKTHFIAAILGTVILALVVVDVVRCIRRRSKLKGGAAPVEVDGDTEIHGKRSNGQDYETSSPENQVEHYMQVPKDTDDFYVNVATSNPEHYGNVFPEEHSDYYGNVTVEERQDMCYYENKDRLVNL